MLAITIVTPAFNAERYLLETVRSVVSQLGPNDRYIVVDDGSSDRTAAVLSEFAERLTIIRQSNQGEAAAVNAGVARATSDIVAIVNADDPILPGLIEAARTAFSDPDLGAVYPDWRMIDCQGAVLRTIETRDFSLKALFCEHLCIPGPGAFFRASVMSGALIRDERAFGMTDYDFWLRFALRNGHVRRLPQVLATWRAHDEGSTFTLPGAKLARAKIDTIVRLFDGDVPEDVRRWRPQALSAAYYSAALVGLRRSGVPALWYTLRSYALKFAWPASIARPQRRSLSRLLYASLQPISGALHALIGPLLPQRFRREAMMMQRFGVRI